MCNRTPTNILITCPYQRSTSYVSTWPPRRKSPWPPLCLVLFLYYVYMHTSLHTHKQLYLYYINTISNWGTCSYSNKIPSILNVPPTSGYVLLSQLKFSRNALTNTHKGVHHYCQRCLITQSNQHSN